LETTTTTTQLTASRTPANERNRLASEEVFMAGASEGVFCWAGAS
jgi:hypothetical protein